MARNSTIHDVINSNWLRNPRKVKVLLAKGLAKEAMSVCRSDFSVAHGGENDINRHMDTAKHKGYANAAQEQRKLTNFSASLATKNFGKKVVEVELNFSDFLIEHNLPLSTAGHSGKLFRNIFPNSKIVNKFQRCCTNTTNMLTGAVANQITSDLKEELLLTC